MNNILVLHGPNLNLLGKREQHIYGFDSLERLNHRLQQLGKERDTNVNCLQSNSEAQLIDYIQSADDSIKFIIINPAGLTHTSVCLRDALLAIRKPFFEVHISNIYAREPFRSHSYFSDVAIGVISGFGTLGYEYALLSAINYVEHQLEISETWQ